MATIYTIERTRLVTEVFRVEADSEDEAVDALDALGLRENGWVEQIAESTAHSEIAILSADAI